MDHKGLSPRHMHMTVWRGGRVKAGDVQELLREDLDG